MGIMFWSKKTYHIGPGCCQTVVKLFNYPVLYNKSLYGWSIRFGSPGVGLNVTTNPLFSVRNGYQRSIKLGKYYLVKL